MADELVTSVHDHIFTLTLNRPAKRNALTTPMIAQLRGIFERVAADDDVRVLVIDAVGAAFCAGLDLAELAAQRAQGAVETRALEETLEILERCPQPTIAAVQGDAIAGGSGSPSRWRSRGSWWTRSAPPPPRSWCSRGSRSTLRPRSRSGS